jgi:hypothetical protein
MLKTVEPERSNNAEQHYSPSFYWKSLTRRGTADAIKKSFGHFEAFKKKFSELPTAILGADWAGLVRAESRPTRHDTASYDSGAPRAGAASSAQPMWVLAPLRGMPQGSSRRPARCAAMPIPNPRPGRLADGVPPSAPSIFLIDDSLYGGRIASRKRSSSAPFRCQTVDADFIPEIYDQALFTVGCKVRK